MRARLGTTPFRRKGLHWALESFPRFVPGLGAVASGFALGSVG